MVDFFDESLLVTFMSLKTWMSLKSLKTWMSHFQVSQDLDEVWKEEEPEA
jgi:hypothetical protein